MADSARRYLRDVSTPLLTDTLGLTMMPRHIDTLVGSVVFFTVIHLVVAPTLSQAFFPEAFGKASRKAQNNWSIHVVSLVHSLVIVVLAVRASNVPALENDRAFAWDDKVGLVAAIAAGYFVWDTVDAIVNFVDIGFVLHGMACALTYILGFRPFSAYYGPRCLFWETSTIFLNIHWFLDKTGRSGSTLQLINGFLLLGTFFGVRLMMGGKTSYDFWHTLYGARNEIPIAYILVYGTGNLLLQSLNWFWFSKMIFALQKRFSSSPLSTSSKTEKVSPSVRFVHGHHANGNGHHK